MYTSIRCLFTICTHPVLELAWNWPCTPARFPCNLPHHGKDAAARKVFWPAFTANISMWATLVLNISDFTRSRSGFPDGQADLGFLVYLSTCIRSCGLE